MKILKTAIYSCWFYRHELVHISLEKLRFGILSKSAAQQLYLVSVEGWILASLHTLSHQEGMDNIPIHAAHKGKTNVSNHSVMSETFPTSEVLPQVRQVSNTKLLCVSTKGPEEAFCSPVTAVEVSPGRGRGSESRWAPPPLPPKFLPDPLQILCKGPCPSKTWVKSTPQTIHLHFTSPWWKWPHLMAKMLQAQIS